MKKNFLELLSQQPILFDGGMGTELYKKGIFIIVVMTIEF